MQIQKCNYIYFLVEKITNLFLRRFFASGTMTSVLSMENDTALIIFYNHLNRYSLNALLGALETDDSFHDLHVSLVPQGDRLIHEIEHLQKRYTRIIAAFSLFTTQLWEIHTVVGRVREKLGHRGSTKIQQEKSTMSLLLIAGGPHPTGDPLGTLDMGFDIAVTGEGEETFIELLKTILWDPYFTITKRNLEEIKGIVFHDEEQRVIKTNPRSWIDMNRYPPYSTKYRGYGPIEITRGCPFGCFFCQTSQICGKGPRHRSIENICSAVEAMRNRGMIDFRAITPNSLSYGSSDGKNLNISALEELLGGIHKILCTGKTTHKQGRIFFGSFPSEARPEQINDQILKLLEQYADNDNLVIGAQSGSQRMLDFCHRNHTVDDIYNAVELAVRSRFRAIVDFILGLPGENGEDIEMTIKVMNDLVRMGAKIHLHTFMPFPGTAFARSTIHPLNNEMRRKIHQLIPRGVAFGDWSVQERLAMKIHRYLNSRKD